MYNVFNKFKDFETIKEFAIAVSEYVFRAVVKSVADKARQWFMSKC